MATPKPKPVSAGTGRIAVMDDVRVSDDRVAAALAVLGRTLQIGG